MDPQDFKVIVEIRSVLWGIRDEAIKTNALLQKLVEKAEKKAKAPKVVNVDTWQEGPVKVSINGVPVEEGSELI